LRVKTKRPTRLRMIEVARSPEGSNELCLFCIDTQSDILDDRVITLDFNSYPDIACTCKVKTHVDCWMKYILHKGHIECPICHKRFQDQEAILRSQPTVAQTQVPQIQIIYTQHAYPQYQNPMIQINPNSGNPSQLTPLPVPIATTEPVYQPIGCSRRGSRNDRCILLTIVLAICIFIVVLHV